MILPIRIRDIAEQSHLLARDFGATLQGDCVALSGERHVCPLPLGLVVHTLDARAEAGFETRAMRARGLIAHIVLEGPVQAWLDENPLLIGREGAEPVRLAISAAREAVAFRRRAQRGDYLRKVNISASWDWLAAHGVSIETVLGAGDLRQESWIAAPDEIAMAERLVALESAEGAASGTPLEREALALALISRVLTRLCPPDGGLRPKDRERLQKMEAFAATPGPAPSLGAIAEVAGMSLSSMQRLFQKAHGMPAQSRIRALRLERAVGQLQGGASVGDAAHGAGYASVEAFATAFRRAYGRSPSELRRGPTQ